MSQWRWRQFIGEIFKRYCSLPFRVFLMIIISGKLYWVFNTKEGSLLIDIHNNGNYSGKISIINNSKLHLPDLEFLDVKRGYMCISKTNIYNNNWIPNLTCVVLNTLSQTKPLVIYQNVVMFLNCFNSTKHLSEQWYFRSGFLSCIFYFLMKLVIHFWWIIHYMALVHYLVTYMYVCVCVCTYVYISIYLSFYLSIYLSIYLSTYLSIYLASYLWTGITNQQPDMINLT